MRRLSTLLAGGATLLATPAFAHHGDAPTHLLVDHGFGAGALALAAVAAGAVFILKRKG